MIFRKLNMALIVLLFSLFLSGCFTSRVNIFVNQDGSGTIDLEFKMNKEQMIAFGTMNGDPPTEKDLSSSDFLTDSALSELAASLGQDVVVVSSECLPGEDAYMGYKARLSFKDITRLKFSPLGTVPDLSDAFFNKGTIAFSRETNAENQDKTINILVGLYPDASGKGQAGMEEDIRAELAPFYSEISRFTSDMNISVTVEFEEPVKKTSALYSEKQTVSLLEFQTGDEELSLDGLCTILMYTQNAGSVTLQELENTGFFVQPDATVPVYF